MSEAKRAPAEIDYERVLVLLEALEMHAQDDSARRPPFWEVLYERHDARGLKDRLQPVADAFVAMEFRHARILLEAHMLHDGRIPVDIGTAARVVCETEGCGKAAYWRFCIECQMRRAFG